MEIAPGRIESFIEPRDPPEIKSFGYKLAGRKESSEITAHSVERGRKAQPKLWQTKKNVSTSL